jgi:hypothetical protein
MNVFSAAEKCRRLLKLERRAGSEAEAFAAHRARMRILERYRLSEAEVELGGEPSEACVCEQDNPIYVFRRAEPWRAGLIGGLCRHFGVVLWRNRLRTKRPSEKRWKSEQSRVYLCGRPSDISCVRQMYAWISAEAMRLVAESDAGKSRSRRRSWLVGFSVGVQHQLEHARADARAEGASCRAIVKLDSRLDEAQAALDAALGKLPSVGARSVSVRVRDYADGASVGSAIHLGERIDGSEEPRLGAAEEG